MHNKGPPVDLEVGQKTFAWLAGWTTVTEKPFTIRTWFFLLRSPRGGGGVGCTPPRDNVVVDCANVNHIKWTQTICGMFPSSAPFVLHDFWTLSTYPTVVTISVLDLISDDARSPDGRDIWQNRFQHSGPTPRKRPPPYS